MKKLILGTLATITMNSTALAQNIPHYDPPAYCKKISHISGGSSVIYKSCMEMEQDAYNALKPLWSQLNSSTRGYCDEIARVSDSSYVILKSCVEMETEAKGASPEFKF